MESWQRRRMVVETFACAEKIGVKADSLKAVGVSAAFDVGCPMLGSVHKTPNIERPASNAEKIKQVRGNRTPVLIRR